MHTETAAGSDGSFEPPQQAGEFVMTEHRQAGSKAGDPERISRLCKGMTEAGLDGLVCTAPSDVLLLTAYWPIFATSVAVLKADGTLRAIVPSDEQELAAKSSAATLTTYEPEQLMQLTGPVEQLRAPLGAILKDLGLEQGKLGVALRLGVQPVSYAVMTEFRHSLQDLLADLVPGATQVSCDNLLETQKAVRTPFEMERMRLGAKVAAVGFAAAEKAIQPGLREAEVAAAIQAAFDAAPEAGALIRSYGFFFCMSGPNSATAAAAYARTRQRRIEKGDLVMIHANTCADGFWTDITRTYTAGGEIVERHQQMRTAIMAARESALKMIRPGVPAPEVDHAARSVMQAHGFDNKLFKHATGHGVGYAAANGNALPRIHPNSPDVLGEGMTFNVEPAAYFEGYGGMRHCDVIAVGAEGAAVLTEF